MAATSYEDFKSCKLCGARPWCEVTGPDDEDVNRVYLECRQCHAMTKPFEEVDDAEAAWLRDEYELPEWARP